MFIDYWIWFPLHQVPRKMNHLYSCLNLLPFSRYNDYITTGQDSIKVLGNNNTYVYLCRILIYVSIFNLFLYLFSRDDLLLFFDFLSKNDVLKIILLFSNNFSKLNKQNRLNDKIKCPMNKMIWKMNYSFDSLSL